MRAVKRALRFPHAPEHRGRRAEHPGHPPVPGTRLPVIAQRQVVHELHRAPVQLGRQPHPVGINREKHQRRQPGMQRQRDQQQRRLLRYRNQEIP